MSTEELSQKIQEVAEARLFYAMEFMNEENDGQQLNALFCGCDTCIVREVIVSAWPYLYKLAHHPDTEPPKL